MKRLKLLVVWMIAWPLYVDISTNWISPEFQHASVDAKGFSGLCCLVVWIVVAVIILKYNKVK